MTEPILKWQLVRMDLPVIGDTICGQYQAQGYSENVASRWGTLTLPGRVAPIQRFSHGEARTAQFEARVYAETQADDVQAWIDHLKSSVEPDAYLGRPPRWRWVCGRTSYPCVVLSLGGISYDEHWPDGRVKGAAFTIAIARDDYELGLEPTDPTKPPRLSSSKPVSRGATYESMARERYGEASVGVFLRQDSEAAFPGPGVVVRMPSRSYFTGRLLEPVATPFLNDAAAAATRAGRIEARSGAAEMPLVRRW